MATKKKPLFSTAPKGGNSLAPWLGVAFIVVLFDQLSKIVVDKLFVFGESRPITSFFNLVLGL